MRTRLLVGLSVMVVALLGAAVFAAAWGGGPVPTNAFALEVTGLSRDQPREVTTTLPDSDGDTVRLFVVRRGHHEADAFRAVSTHLGCRVLLRSDRDAITGVTVSRATAFEDPCGGSVFSLDGRCVGGPCPRGLDRYPTDVHDGTVEVDLTHLVKGPQRGA